MGDSNVRPTIQSGRLSTSGKPPEITSYQLPTNAGKPKLLDQVRQAIRTRHYSPRTEETYVHWIKRFIFFHNKRHPVEMGEKEIAQFLSGLARDSHVSASTQNQALNATLFLYREVLRKEIGYVNGVVRAKKPRRLPVVLTKEEVERVLGQLSGSPWLMSMLLYGAGLRVMECCRLRVKDIEFSQNEILVRAGKPWWQGSSQPGGSTRARGRPTVVARADIYAMFAGNTFPLLTVENNYKIAQIYQFVGRDGLTN
jgi:integrase